MIAVLYTDPRGPYPLLRAGRNYVPVGPHGTPECYSWGPPREIDCWDLTRDARLYDGPHAIVAHPPCGPWSSNRHHYQGSEHDCAVRAVEQVRRWGGVLEHPHTSLLWSAVIDPTYNPDLHRMPEYTIEIEQVEWGHVARKRTKLFLVGVPRSALEAPPFPGREPTHWCSGRRGMARACDNVPAGIKVCSAQQRRRTPPLLAEYLVRLAQSISRP